jgi:hypothetical protein
MTEHSNTCGELCRTIKNRKSKIEMVSPNILARADRVIR